jgi:hypothetical protein
VYPLVNSFSSAPVDRSNPLNGEEAVLTGFLFPTGEGEYGGIPRNDIVVTISGLRNIASNYQVRLLASSEWYEFGFTPAQVTDGVASEQVDFQILQDGDLPASSIEGARPRWYSTAYNETLPSDFVVPPEFPNHPDPSEWTATPTGYGTAGKGAATATFDGDTLTVTIVGNNEYQVDGQRWRSSLAAVIVDYTASNPGLPGDFDSDGDVDGADFVVWQTNFPSANGHTLATGDADNDGDVDAADFAAWQNSFPSGTGTVTVPEPGTWLMLVVGGSIALAVRRRRQ